MTNFIKQKILTFRKSYIFGVILLVLCNLIFITLYYGIYINNTVEKNYITITNDLNNKIDYIKDNIDTINLKEYATKNKISITIKDNNDLIVNYNKKNKDNTIIVSDLITIDNETKLIELGTKHSTKLKKIEILKFFFFELVILAILSVIGILTTNTKILKPIVSIIKDFNNYKFGILPKKNNKQTEVSKIHNSFVDLINQLEDEKKKEKQIIASISHDIKTPLTSILGYSELLVNNENLNEATKIKYANRIHNKSLTIKEIIEEFDDYLGINIKKEHKEVITIKYLIEYLKNYYKDDLLEKNIELKIKTNCPNSTLSLDIYRIKRVFSNIISNSIRYLKKDNNEIIITINKIKHDKIKIEIADNGTGTKEDLNKLFEPLFTTDKGRKISGLGLSICKEIIKSHDGNIHAENNNLGGLSIIIELPEHKE